jgi:hypothetical protein
VSFMRVALSMVELPLQSFDVCDAGGVTGAAVRHICAPPDVM